ncbi:MFS transporter [Flexivirga oryzae]|uniref:MFS family permease n=1 Tax=Flexivirga oryzae TaxID=1794944 RepID=A0A839NB14_9MICO|nr:MFS transporter [Flexivirga oryzae]MBB2891911.1 MFS family permease [Flexivirga oryzae]
MITALEASSPPISTTHPTTFGSLRIRNYRLFAFGQALSNTGSWVQRIAQDWLVLTLAGGATAVGITTALQALPTLLFGLVGGLIADRCPKRLVLLTTQTAMAVLATVLAGLLLTRTVQVWQVYVVAFALGSVIAIDNPTRQAFVNELVGPDQLRNAIGLNSSIFQLGALLGPALSAVLINTLGIGWAFTINALSYLGPILMLLRVRDRELHRTVVVAAGRGQLRDALRYARVRPDVLWPIVLVGVFGLFTLNLPVTLAAYAKNVFHTGAGGYGILNCALAVGSLTGALVAARREHTRLRDIAAIGAGLAGAYLLASLVTDEAAYLVLLLLVGALTLLLTTAANAMVQLASDDDIRGRVMALYLMVFTGSGAVGGPLLGYLDEHAGPQAGMLVAGAVPALATACVTGWLAHSGQLRLTIRLARHQRPALGVIHR